MRLSEAIRLGAMLKPKGIGCRTIQGDAVCALGGAADAVGIPLFADLNDRYRAIERVWPFLFDCGHVHPENSELNGEQVRCVIWSLNDSYDWTREQIADWVQGIEDTLSTEPNGTPAAVAVPVSA